MIPKHIKIPEGDTKENIDKTVGYVLKHDEVFENKLKSQPDKFPFIFNDHEYYRYYQWKLGRLTDDDSNGRSGRSNGTANDRVTSGISLEGNNDTKQPQENDTVEELQFLISKGSIPPIDYEIIKLTALFTAKNGLEYLKSLHEHVSKNNKSQFEFLNSTHSYNPIFKKLVRQYQNTITMLTEPKPLANKKLFENSYKRAKYNKNTKLKQDNNLKYLKERQLQYASIDWQDFTLIGKIEFNAVDQVIELPKAIKRDDLIKRSLEERSKELELEMIESTKQEEKVIEDEPSANETDIQKEEEIEKPKFPGKIRAAGETRLKKSKQSTIICPITGVKVLENKFDEHLKILLRDPNYSTQKQNYINKNFKYGSNLSDDEVYENIKRLTRKRVIE